MLDHKNTAALVSNTMNATGEEKDILQRFAKVFEQTYTRFLDLQKAEAQTREAQIEAALERVRSRSMAMHRTFELQDVINTVYQINELKLALTGGGFSIAIKCRKLKMKSVVGVLEGWQMMWTCI